MLNNAATAQSHDARSLDINVKGLNYMNKKSKKKKKQKKEKTKKTKKPKNRIDLTADLRRPCIMKLKYSQESQCTLKYFLAINVTFV